MIRSLVFLATIACIALPCAAAQNVAPGAARVAPAIALVATADATGTAFAVASTINRTTFITAAHVVGCASTEACASVQLTVYLGGDLRSPRGGHIVAVGTTAGGNDLAAFTIDEGPLPTVVLGGALGVRHDAAVLGYPAVTLRALQQRELEASATAVLSIGTIRSEDALETQGDFRAFPGDSGGPVFDPASGRVTGVVHGQAPNAGPYLAVAAPTLARFVNALPKTDAAAAAPAPARTDTALAATAYAQALAVQRSDPGEYVRQLRIAADARNGIAADDLGDAYGRGTGVEKNRALEEYWTGRAIDLLQMPSARSDGAALLRLSKIAERGELGPPSDPRRYTPEYTQKTALDYLQRAVKAGNAAAMYDLGRDYHSGYLVTRDDVQARRWYCAAAVRGVADAAMWLFFIYSDSSDIPQFKDKATADRWYDIEQRLRATATSSGAAAEARTLCTRAGVALP